MCALPYPREAFRLWIVGFLLGVVLCSSARGDGLDEYRFKAAFLYNFVKFVEWPADTFTGPSEPLAICVAGRNPIAPQLEGIVKGRTVAGRALQVRVLPDMQAVERCHVLFITASEKKRAWILLDQIANASVLTVGETDEFTAVGGMVNLKLAGTQIRIQIALDHIQHAKLLVSSKLLSLAEIVRK